MDKKYLKRVGIYVLSTIAALGLVFYIIYHMMDGFTTDIDTLTAEVSSKKFIISAEGYIFKDEHYLYSSYDGSVNYLIKDGEKVGIRQEVATSFADLSGYSINSELSKIENKLAVLDQSSVSIGAANTDTKTVDKRISSYYYMILSRLAEGKYSHVIHSTDNLLIQMNKRQLITGEQKNFSDLRSSLESKKSNLMAQLNGRSETIYSDVSGYFFSEIDGYEEIFTKKSLENLTVSDFYRLIEEKPKGIKNVDGKTPIGKIADNYIWYIVFPINKEDAENLEIQKTYSGIFPYNYDAELSLKLEKIITEQLGDRTLAVFSCSEMPEGFNYQRSQAIEIIANEAKGFRIPKNAVRLVDGVQGVYTLYGSTVIFKRIDILFEADGHYIISTEDPLKKEPTDSENGTDSNSGESADTEAQKQKTYPYLKLYDSVIISGKELKDGMVFY
ncbi:MAG: hypothetical protein IKT56_03410 [Clostridia bacterium]|nr:hypothetical protein [Clostridia bacterium]